MMLTPPKIRQLSDVAEYLNISISDLLIFARDNEIDISVILKKSQKITRTVRSWLSPPETEDGLFKLYTDTHITTGEQSTIKGVFALGVEVINDILLYEQAQITSIYDLPVQVLKKLDCLEVRFFLTDIPLIILQDDLILREEESVKIIDLFELEGDDSLQDDEPGRSTKEIKKAKNMADKEFVINEFIPYLKKEYPRLKCTTDIGKYFKNKYDQSNELEKRFYEICIDGGVNWIYTVYDWITDADPKYFIKGSPGNHGKPL